jgi:hypothetical protein
MYACMHDGGEDTVFMFGGVATAVALKQVTTIILSATFDIRYISARLPSATRVAENNCYTGSVSSARKPPSLSGKLARNAL